MKWISLQVMYAYYHDCDPMTTRQVNKKDQLFPLFVMQVNNIFITKLVNLVNSKAQYLHPQTPGDERLPWSARTVCSRRLLRGSFHRFCLKCLYPINIFIFLYIHIPLHSYSYIFIFLYIHIPIYIFIQGVPKKCNIAIFSLNLFQRSDYAFSQVFRNQNFEPIPSGHF